MCTFSGKKGKAYMAKSTIWLCSKGLLASAGACRSLFFGYFQEGDSLVTLHLFHLTTVCFCVLLEIRQCINHRIMDKRVYQEEFYHDNFNAVES
ncbi:hypothetical protein CVU75_00775 [Candidatus Dependentiae bacterium HGW-Dependentiae-1]|nr:MAG: hypothetical protein CVU75_00775 [Candidatus Dependentiae bacterium HGW-Dependentiae-1]